MWSSQVSLGEWHDQAQFPRFFLLWGGFDHSVSFAGLSMASRSGSMWVAKGDSLEDLPSCRQSNCSGAVMTPPAVSQITALPFHFTPYRNIVEMLLLGSMPERGETNADAELMDHCAYCGFVRNGVGVNGSQRGDLRCTVR